MMLLFSLMFPVFAQGFGDAFDNSDDDERESQETEQAEMELLLQLETCKETPDTETCQQFFKEHGADLGVNVEQYIQPTVEQETFDSVDNKETEKNEVQQKTFAKPAQETLNPTETEAAEKVDVSTSKKGVDFQQGIGISVGRTTFQTFILNQAGVSFQKNIDNLLLRTTVSVLTTTQTLAVLDQNGEPTDSISISQIMIPSVEEAVLLSFDLGQTFTPYAGAGLEGWFSYAGPQSGVSTAIEGILGVDLEVGSRPTLAATVNAELNAGIMSGENFVRVPTVSGEYLEEQDVFWSFSIQPTIAF